MKDQLTSDIVNVAPDIKFAATEAVNFLLRAGLSKSAIENAEPIAPRYLTAYGRKRSEHVAAAAELLYWEREFAGAIADGRTSDALHAVFQIGTCHGSLIGPRAISSRGGRARVSQRKSDRRTAIEKCMNVFADMIREGGSQRVTAARVAKRVAALYQKKFRSHRWFLDCAMEARKRMQKSKSAG